MQRGLHSRNGHAPNLRSDCNISIGFIDDLVSTILKGSD